MGMMDTQWPHLVRELQGWEAEGFLRYHGVEECTPRGAVYLIETTPGTTRRLTELQVHDLVLGLYAGRRPRFAVPVASTVAASRKGAA